MEGRQIANGVGEMNPWLIIDSHFMCHRAFHTCGDLSHRGISTGVIYGFLKSVDFLMSQFGTENVAFCFEGRNLLRRVAYPQYKMRRDKVRERDAEKEKGYQELNRQIQSLRETHLPRIGFRNIFCIDGFESDDLMAALADDNKVQMIFVTSDSDMLQCLSWNVRIWNPIKSKMITRESFIKDKGIAPFRWADVKALSGCKSDNIDGIPGVGERTALKYLTNQCSNANREKILLESSQEIYRRNLLLVQLPHRKCPKINLSSDRRNMDAWNDVCDELGFSSITKSYRR